MTHLVQLLIIGKANCRTDKNQTTLTNTTIKIDQLLLGLKWKNCDKRDAVVRPHF